MASAILLIGLTACFASSVKILDLVRAAKQQAAASHALQERMEQIRSSNWQQVTDADWMQSTDFLGVETSSATALPPITETVYITQWPPVESETGPWAHGVRFAGMVTSEGSDNLKSTNAVRVDLSISWTATSKVQRTYSTSAIVAKGGVLR